MHQAYQVKRKRDLESQRDSIFQHMVSMSRENSASMNATGKSRLARSCPCSRQPSDLSSGLNAFQCLQQCFQGRRSRRNTCEPHPLLDSSASQSSLPVKDISPFSEAAGGKCGPESNRNDASRRLPSFRRGRLEYAAQRLMSARLTAAAQEAPFGARARDGLDAHVADQRPGVHTVLGSSPH